MCGVIYLLDGCILLFASQGIVSFDGCFLSICGFVYFGFSLRFRICYWVDRCNGCFALALLSRYIRVGGCGVDGVLGCLRGVIYLLDGCIFLFSS